MTDQIEKQHVQNQMKKSFSKFESSKEQVKPGQMFSQVEITEKMKAKYKHFTSLNCKANLRLWISTSYIVLVTSLESVLVNLSMI